MIYKDTQVLDLKQFQASVWMPVDCHCALIVSDTGFQF